MGKRTKNLSGLSHFAKQAFQKKTTLAIGSSNVAREPSSSQHHFTSHDPTQLVPHYTTASEVPEHLQKYFSQRKRYFTLYDQGCLLDEEGWYSVTPELIANQIAERCRCDTILDAFCGVGGNAIAFAKTCEHVIALDISPVRLALARHNAAIYGVADRIEFILADYISFAHAHASRPAGKRPIDVVFLSPPWGGPDYMLQGNGAAGLGGGSGDASSEQLGCQEFSLAQIEPIHGADLFHLTRKITRNVAYFLPRNASLYEISTLLTDGAPPPDQDSTEMIEVEEAWMGTKLKALTCYFGGLADDQQHLFYTQLD
ncbi:Tgs1 protein [Chiua virens]|nr:Tgs1 protein [Chiua virens]